MTLTPRIFALHQTQDEKGKIDDSENIPLQNYSTVSAADAVTNLSSEAFVVHEEKVDFPDIVYQKFLETIGEEMTSLDK